MDRAAEGVVGLVGEQAGAVLGRTRTAGHGDPLGPDPERRAGPGVRADQHLHQAVVGDGEPGGALGGGGGVADRDRADRPVQVGQQPAVGLHPEVLAGPVGPRVLPTPAAVGAALRRLPGPRPPGRRLPGPGLRRPRLAGPEARAAGRPAAVGQQRAGHRPGRGLGRASELRAPVTDESGASPGRSTVRPRRTCRMRIDVHDAFIRRSYGRRPRASAGLARSRPGAVRPARSRFRPAGDPQVPEDDSAVLVDQQVEPAFRAPGHRSGRLDRTARRPQRPAQAQ